MSENTIQFPIDVKGIDKIVTNDKWYAAGLFAFVASWPAAIYSVVWSIMWIVQDGNGHGTSVQANWNLDPHLFMLYGFVALCWTLLPYCESRWNRAKLKEGTNSYQITKAYNQLTPINRDLAEPLVLKVYELERSGIYNDDVRTAYAKRLQAVKKIQSQQEADIHSSLVIDNSDLEAVEYVLKKKKEIANA